MHLLNSLGCRNVRARPRWVQASCPFARWRHKGSDQTPSFGIKIEPEGKSHYRCLGCNAVGSLNGLVWAVEACLGYKLPDLARFVHRQDQESLAAMQAKAARLSRQLAKDQQRPEGEVVNIPDESGFVRVKPVEHVPVYLSETELWHFKFLPPDAMEWPVFAKRQITLETLRRFGVLWHPEAHRVGIPVRDGEGRLTGLTGRVLLDSICSRCLVKYKTKFLDGKDRKRCPVCNRAPPPKYLHSTGFRRDFSLFGEHMIPNTRPEGCIVEGHFDVMGVTQAGFPTVGIMGAYLSWWQAARIQQLFSSVVIVPDGDKAGMQIATALYLTLSARMPVRIVMDMPEGRDPDQMIPELPRMIANAAQGADVVKETAPLLMR